VTVLSRERAPLVYRRHRLIAVGSLSGVGVVTKRRQHCGLKLQREHEQSDGATDHHRAHLTPKYVTEQSSGLAVARRSAPTDHRGAVNLPPYLTLAEGIKLAAQTFTKDVAKSERGRLSGAQGAG